jgi:hypothetical protein
MGWHGPYYYRSRRDGSRVVREYIGTGQVAERAALLDALARQRRLDEAAERRTQRDLLRALEEPVEQLNALTDLVARAALLATGYHQHKRQWRKRREHHGEGGRPPGADRAGPERG